jgi:hypothetical protein
MTSRTNWHCISLSRPDYESGELGVLMGAFRAAYVARNGPEGMAMFGRWADDESQYLIYTSPKSARHIMPLLQAYSAKQSNRPDAAGLSLICGDESGFSASETSFEA